ncbi:hypothetical protein EV421DRAFT_1923324 [Armillaria borealis]|uniref:Uncharacterized protein n=1 Tax=Armillaria borealis TaxID=47425 RepID=A0AA39K9B6_9AGAR|nr:hypothetical protein EV421DRAFT_1923324 [Armillaria borealis]
MADFSDSQSNMEHPVFGDWGASTYNDGNGISCKIGFQPFSDPNMKKRKSGKLVTISKALGLHEDWAFTDFLVWVVAKTLQRDNLLEYSSLYQSGPVPHDSFTVSYTIPHTHLQDVMLSSEHDYLTMIKAAKAKAKPKASITIIKVW